MAATPTGLLGIFVSEARQDKMAAVFNRPQATIYVPIVCLLASYVRVNDVAVSSHVICYSGIQKWPLMATLIIISSQILCIL